MSANRRFDMSAVHLIYFTLSLLTISHCHGSPGSSKPLIRSLNPYAHQLKLLRQEPPLKLSKEHSNTDHIEELWIEQKLDHFQHEAAHNKTWFMRYYRNAEYFEAGGPIFIFVGGEWEISPSYLLTGLMHDVAKQHSGMLYYVEHRYYGQSWPAETTSAEDLKYLKTRQVLADVAHFILETKASSEELLESQVVLVGASYSGSLVAWFAKLYPHLLSAGWASSAPLVAKMDFYEYMQHVGTVIKANGGVKCHQRMQQSAHRLVMLLQNDTTAASLMQRWHICDNFAPTTNAMDRAALFNGIGNYFAAIVQSYSEQIADMCEYLLAPHTADEAEVLLHYVFRMFESPTQKDNNEWCIDFTYDSMEYALFGDITDTVTGTRQWLYQSCQEFGWFPTTRDHHTTTPHGMDVFGGQVPLRYFQQLCSDAFGRVYTGHGMSLSAQQANSNFGALLHVSPRVVFTHGQWDPWRAVGLQNGRNVINIPGSSHCADLGSINFDDSVELNVAKLKVAAFLRSVLRNDKRHTDNKNLTKFTS